MPTEREELLALVDAAPGALPRLTGEVREHGVGNGLGRLGRLPPVRPGDELRLAAIDLSPLADEERWRLWFGAPDRWRIEGPERRLTPTG